MSLFEVFKQFVEFFVKGTTIAPEIIELFALGLTLGFVWLVILNPIYKLIRGNK